MTWDPEAARAQSRAELEGFGLHVNPNLPLLGDDEVGRCRPVGEVVARCQALFGVLAVVEGVPSDRVVPSLEERGLTRWVAESELAARLDVFYCAHWCVRHHELEGEPDPWPEAIVQDVVWERRHGLEFLFADTDDWDEISLDT